MRSAIVLFAVIGLTASAALAQDASDQWQSDASRISIMAQTPVYLSSSGRDDPVSAALSEAIRKEFENSRPLELVYASSDLVMQVSAPTAIVVSESPKGQVVSMTYEISNPRGSGLTYKANCAVKKVDDCARSVLMRAERFVRDSLLQK